MMLAPGVAGAGEVVDYVRQVKPILKQRCYSCHGVLKQKAGLRLDTAASIRKGGDSGPAVEPASPDESELIGRVAETDSKRRMPPEGEPLSAEQVSRLREWIVQGANAPRDETPEEDSRRHWAFLKPVRPAVPQVKNAGWVRNPIDAFLAVEHERKGLTPLAPAAPEVLVRRVYLDLTGLPPTREELRAFLQDPSETRYGQLVERLLASPAYGERWARHWMDVWRYSDWYGRRAVPDVTNSYAMLWRWRDWIVRSLNEDKGYDRMIAEMLAADELCPADDANVVATGFVLRNFYRWNYNTWMRDNVEHTAKAFLGLTIQCAHCHDHKYDPITQEDYFAFRAIFEPLEVRHDRVPGEPDPGPFPKYVYGSAYKPITSGMARVVDEQLDAKTFLYTRGESRNVVPGKAPIPPGVPAFLGGSFHVESVSLPATAYYPGLKPFIQQEELQKAEKALAEAELAAAVARRKQEEAGTALDLVTRAWHDRSSPPAFSGRDDVRAFRHPLGLVPPDVQGARDASESAELTYRLVVERAALARARLESVKARVAADVASFGKGSDDFESLRLAASRAERAVELAQARLNLALIAQTLGAARQKARTDPKAAAEVAKAEGQRRKALDSSAGVPSKDLKAYSPLSPVYPKTSTGRRKALALWITSRDNPLTARVAVNHVWRWHFHQPLVASTFDFGRNGKRPANPLLLDWLAVELMDPSTPGAKPWELKSLHRLIVMSTAYRMSSHASDPDHPNRAPGQGESCLLALPRVADRVGGGARQPAPCVRPARSRDRRSRHSLRSRADVVPAEPLLHPPRRGPDAVPRTVRRPRRLRCLHAHRVGRPPAGAGVDQQPARSFLEPQPRDATRPRGERRQCLRDRGVRASPRPIAIAARARGVMCLPRSPNREPDDRGGRAFAGGPRPGALQPQRFLDRTLSRGLSGSHDNESPWPSLRSDSAPDVPGRRRLGLHGARPWRDAPARWRGPRRGARELDAPRRQTALRPQVEAASSGSSCPAASATSRPGTRSRP